MSYLKRKITPLKVWTWLYMVGSRSIQFDWIRIRPKGSDQCGSGSATLFNAMIFLYKYELQGDFFPVFCVERHNPVPKIGSDKNCYVWFPGLGTTFFSVLFLAVRYVLFRSKKKNVPFFSILFSSFLRLMKPKRTLGSFPFFSKEQKRTQRT